MSRMLKALKQLENRGVLPAAPAAPAAEERPQLAPLPSLVQPLAGGPMIQQRTAAIDEPLDRFDLSDQPLPEPILCSEEVYAAGCAAIDSLGAVVADSWQSPEQGDLHSWQPEEHRDVLTLRAEPEEIAPEPVAEAPPPLFPAPEEDDPASGQQTAQEPAPPLEIKTLFQLPVDLLALDGYRQMRDRLIAQRAGAQSSLLLFAGADRLAANRLALAHLAAAFAEVEPGEIVLVDADLSRPRLSEQIGAAARPGIVEVLQGRARWEEVLLSTTTAGVRFVPAGSGAAPTQAPADLGCLQQLRRGHRFVLIAAGAAGESHATWLAAVCDVAYLGVSIHETRRQQALETLSAWRAIGVNVGGCIVANAPSG